MSQIVLRWLNLLIKTEKHKVRDKIRLINE